jgi:phosphatidylglycerophosphate synthase
MHMSRHVWIGVGGVILGLILLAVLPWWVPVLIIAAAIAVPVIGWVALGGANQRRIKRMHHRGQLGR